MAISPGNMSTTSGVGESGPSLPMAQFGGGQNILELFQNLGSGPAIFGGVFAVVSTIWTIYVVLIYLFCLILIYLYIYASIKLQELQTLQAEAVKDVEQQYQRYYGTSTVNARWQELQGHIESTNPNDWKLAIIEADIMLDDALDRYGYGGVSLGEKLRSISPSAMRTLDDAWQAHKVRNDIAHAGADFILTHKIAKETITRYQRVFEELGVV